MHLQRGARARVSGDVRVKLRAVRASGARPGRSRRRERSTRDARAEALAERAEGRCSNRSSVFNHVALCRKVNHGPDDSPRQNSFPLLWVRIEIQQSSRRITMGGGAGVSGVRGSQSVDLGREGRGGRPSGPAVVSSQLNLGSHGIYEDAMGSCTSWCSLCEEGHCGLPQKTGHTSRIPSC